jgi:hypothetical protein
MSVGTYNLGDTSITSALTNQVITAGVSEAGVAQAFLDNLEDMEQLSVFVNFVWGSGGTTCIVIVQTTFDDVNWIDIARFDFATASASKVCTLSGELSKGITSVAALGAEGVNDGVLGAKLRAKVTSTGTYAGNTSVSVRAEVH